MESACIAVNRDIESEIEYQNTDAAIIETLEANDYEFYLNGKIAWKTETAYLEHLTLICTPITNPNNNLTF